MKKSKTGSVTARNPKEIALALGITSEAEQAMMEAKADLSILATKAIKHSGLTVNELVKRSGVSRSKVSAIKNGCLAGISIDLFIKVIAASGGHIRFKVAS